MLKRGWESSDTWALCSHEYCARCLNIYEYHFKKTGIWKHNHVRHHVLIGQREAFVVPRKLCDAQTLCLLWKATYRVGNSHKYQAKSPASYTNPRPKYLDVVQKLGRRYHKNSQSLSNWKRSLQEENEGRKWKHQTMISLQVREAPFWKVVRA